jgi:hypothetical protein
VDPEPNTRTGDFIIQEIGVRTVICVPPEMDPLGGEKEAGGELRASKRIILFGPIIESDPTDTVQFSLSAMKIGVTQETVLEEVLVAALLMSPK